MLVMSEAEDSRVSVSLCHGHKPVIELSRIDNRRGKEEQRQKATTAHVKIKVLQATLFA